MDTHLCNKPKTKKKHIFIIGSSRFSSPEPQIHVVLVHPPPRHALHPHMRLNIVLVVYLHVIHGVFTSMSNPRRLPQSTDLCSGGIREDEEEEWEGLGHHAPFSSIPRRRICTAIAALLNRHCCPYGYERERERRERAS